MTLYQVDAFTNILFKGNPAAVCVLDNNWLEDDVMQNIAAENNLAETAFVLKKDEEYGIRWFTPTVEVALCGHATLASAHVLFNYYGLEGTINFSTKSSGLLKVTKQGEWMTLDFPCDTIKEVPHLPQIRQWLGKEPLKTYKGKDDYLIILNSEQEVKDIILDRTLVNSIVARGVIVSAPGETVDFVSRFFGPQVGVDEDPVTGSAHTTLTPYWAAELHKASLTAKQLSARGGELICELNGDRVFIKGQAITYLKGEIFV